MQDETSGNIAWWVATIAEWVVLIFLGLPVLFVASVRLGLIGP